MSERSCPKNDDSCYYYVKGQCCYAFFEDDKPDICPMEKEE